MIEATRISTFPTIKDWNKIICKAESHCFNHVYRICGDISKIDLKHSGHNKAGYKTTQEMIDLIVCLLAHLRYLQEDFTSGLIAGKSGDTTKGNFLLTTKEYQCIHAYCD